MYSVGYRAGLIEDDQRRNWDDTGPRPLAWSAWYPAQTDAAVRAAETPEGLFALGDIHPEAPLLKSSSRPVVLLSHGTGGAPESLGWLAFLLAQAGYVVIGAHHHGNTGSEPYFAEGFLCWWERAADLSTLLTRLAATGPFAGWLDLGAVHAAGFSLGGHTVLSLAGAISEMERYRSWSDAIGQFQSGPREFPSAAKDIESLMTRSKVLRQSWARHAESFAESRLRSAIAIAAAPPVRAFRPDTLASITIPVTLISGGADEEAPTEHCADWLCAVNPDFVHHRLGEDIGHYTFLGAPARTPSPEQEVFFTDRPGTDRGDVHRHAGQIILRALRSVDV